MVSEYKNNECKYRIDKLDNVVYLVNEQSLRNIKIDNGEAYVEDIAQQPLMLHCYNISLEDTETLDERYEFTHTVKFSVVGYANWKDLQGRYYVIVRTVDNEYWLVNPLFPCKVTYTYTLGHQDSHTDFTLSTISNHPTLRIHNMTKARPYICKDYLLNGIDRLFLNEKMYSTHSGNQIYYTNDGFKEVIFDRQSATFTEQFDGDNVSHSIQFNIKFDDYKDSWHYNLLEFTENLYAAVITTTKKEYVLCGFGFGLQPSYTVTSDGEMTPDHIEIRLSDMHNNGDLFTLVQDGTISLNDDRTYQFTLEYDAWECVDDGFAKYLLQRELDVLGNPTGNYKCLSGYEEDFSFLGDNLISTFDDVVTFYQPLCKESGCTLNTSLVSPLKMSAGECSIFSIKADSDWEITNNASYLSFNPTSGNANTIYTVSACNTSQTSANTSFTIDYCDTSESFDVQIETVSTCFYGGDEFNISSLEQYVTIPIECCTNWIEDPSGIITDIKLYENYIKVFVPQNDTMSARTFNLDVTMCDGTHSEVVINQTNYITRWWSVPMGGEYLCSGSTKYEKEYYQISYDNGNTWEMVLPIQTRMGDVIEQSSRDCQISIRWVETQETVCYEGKKYVIEQEQIKYSNTDWMNTSNRRRGGETEDSPSECSGSTIEEWRVDTSEYICDGTTKYEELKLYISEDSGATWTPTETIKKGIVLEYDSEDCGYEPPSGETYYEWRVENTACNGFDLYNYEQKYVSYDGNTWSPTGIWRYGTLIEANSTQCGYTPPIVYEYRWLLTSATTCVGYDKYEVYKKQQSSDSGATWQDVVPTTTSYNGEGTMTPVLVESASTDCGYVPPVEPIYRWWAVPSSSEYICSGTSKYTKEYYQVSYDNGSTWQNVVPTQTRAGEFIESASTDCGYEVLYKWEVISGYTCSGCTKYERTQKFVSTDGGQTWAAVTPPEYGIGNVVEQGSADCGCGTQYRWVVVFGEYICSGTTKYTKEKKQVSHNNGQTWSDVVPLETRANGIIEEKSVDCGYGQPIYRWVDGTMCDGCLAYKVSSLTTGGTTINVECNSSSTLVSSEVTNRSVLSSTCVGNCVTAIGDGAFSGCTLLSNARIPSTISSIGNRAFLNCSGLLDASIPDSVSSIGDYAFSGCTQLSCINLPNYLQTLGNSAFASSKNFQTINIPITLTYIPNQCFYDCDGLSDIVLPNSITSIGDNAFTNCSGLYNFTIYALTPPTMGSNVFSGVNISLRIFVPPSAVDTYKSASGWSTYASMIQAIIT